MNARNARLLCLMLPPVLAGCSHSLTFEPAQDHNQLESLEFFHLLAQQPMVTYDEACRAMLLLANGTETSSDFETRSAELASRGVISEKWGIAANEAVDRGTLGYMIFRTCRLPDSVNTWLAKCSGLGDRRYALKNVVRAGIMPYGLPYQIPTGGEVLAAIRKADDYMADHGVYETTDVKISSPADVQSAGQP